MAHVNDPKQKLKEAFTAFYQELGLNEEVYLKILRQALTDVEHDMPLLSAAISLEDLKVIQEISHRIKGTAGNLRLYDILPVVSELNGLAKKGEDKKRYPSLFAQIESGFKMYFSALEE